MRSFNNLYILFIFSVIVVMGCTEESKDKDHNKTSKMEKEHKSMKVHWTYEGENGPNNWGKLHEKFEPCAKGKSQSPIDLVNHKEGNELTDLKMSYKPIKMNIVNNGHTIQVNYDKGSTLTLNDKKYQLLQFHFHSHSEHTVEGKYYDLEMHLVHKDDSNNLAVVGVLFKKGSENHFLKKIWNQMPNEVNKVVNSDEELTLIEGLPKNQSYYHYSGSLTTPPCSEGVSWNVLTTPLELSESQIKQFVDIVKENNRPVQPHNNRVLQIKQ